jgi:hypothetical protein
LLGVGHAHIPGVWGQGVRIGRTSRPARHSDINTLHHPCSFNMEFFRLHSSPFAIYRPKHGTACWYLVAVYSSRTVAAAHVSDIAAIPSGLRHRLAIYRGEYRLRQYQYRGKLCLYRCDGHGFWRRCAGCGAFAVVESYHYFHHDMGADRIR